MIQGACFEQPLQKCPPERDARSDLSMAEKGLGTGFASPALLKNLVALPLTSYNADEVRADRALGKTPFCLREPESTRRSVGGTVNLPHSVPCGF